jgi:hypothetical protein
MRKPGSVAALIVVCAIIAFSAAVFYSLRLNPELRVMAGAARVKLAWSERISRVHTNKVVVFGGSSSSFSIDPEYAMQKHEIPVANLGMFAGMGTPVLTRFALEQAREGDTVIASIEPILVATARKNLQAGIQFAFAMGRPDWAAPGFDFANKKIPYTAIASLPPSGEHVFILLTKLLRREPLYRYKVENFTEAGQQFDTNAIRVVSLVAPGKVDGEYLSALKRECARRKLRLVYALPWQYCLPQDAEKLRRQNAEFVKEVAKYLPVLEEANLGVYTNAAGIGDYLYHLNRKGAIERTESLLQALKKQEALWAAEKRN